MASSSTSTKAEVRLKPISDRTAMTDDDELQARLAALIYPLESGSVGDDGLHTLDDITRRTDHPEQRVGYFDQLQVGQARNLRRALREAAREHMRRAESLEVMAGQLTQHLHTTAEGEQADPGSPGTRAF